MSNGSKPLHCIDGWYTDDPVEFRFYTRDLKNWTYAKQLRVDVRGWKPWLWWLMGVVPLVFAVASGSHRVLTHAVVFSAAVFLMYGHMLRRVVRGYQRAVLLPGFVPTFDRHHPLRRHWVAGRLTTREPFHEPVQAMLPKWAVDAYAGPDGSMEVLVSHLPEAEYSPVIGLKVP